MDTNSYATKIKDTLFDCISTMENYAWFFCNNPKKDFTRNRKFSFSETIKVILSLRKSSMKEELLKYFNFDENAPTQSAFTQQRSKIKPEAFEFLLQKFVEATEDTSKRIKGLRVFACDGSSTKFATDSDDSNTYGISYHLNGYSGYNLFHINALYDLNNNTYSDAIITTLHNKDERGCFLSMVSRYSSRNDKYSAVFIADRGYDGLNVMAHVIEDQQYFLIRTKSPSVTSFLKNYQLPDNQETFDVKIKKFIIRKPTKDSKTNPDAYKVIGKQSYFDFVPPGTNIPYYMEFRVVKVKLNDNSYEYLLTNLPTYMFDSNELKNLYYLRWGIETSFRDLKYSIGLSSFHARKPECVLQEIYAELIVYNFCELITSFIAINDRDTKYTYKINFAAAVVICMEFLRQAPGSSPMNVAALIGKFLTPIRTGRQSKRRGMRQKPFTFLYR